MNLLPSFEPREPEARRLTPPELRDRLMTYSRLIKETKSIKAILSKVLPDCETKSWMISALDNRVVGLMNDATFTAKALAGIQEPLV